MKQIQTKRVVEYRYDSEEEAYQHEIAMKREGWYVESRDNYLIKNFRSYSKVIPQGSFL